MWPFEQRRKRTCSTSPKHRRSSTSHSRPIPPAFPEATAPQVLELEDGDTLNLHVAARSQTAWRQHRADARLQRLDPRPDPPRPTGIRGHRQRHQRRRPGHHRALARATAGEQVRRCTARDPAADPDRGQLHLPHPVPRPRPVLVPPAHSRGLHPGDGPLRQHHRRARRTGVLARPTATLS